MHLKSGLDDYVGTMRKRERIDGKLIESEMEFTMQCRKFDGDQQTHPMRVYLLVSTPENIAGREVIWVEDERDGKLIAHESGLLNLAYATLDPTGDRAMEDNLYPITEIGMINLIEQLIRRGELLRQAATPNEVWGRPHEPLPFGEGPAYNQNNGPLPQRGF